MSSDEALNIVENSSTDAVDEPNIGEQTLSGQGSSEDLEVAPEVAAEEEIAAKDSPKDPIAEEDASTAADFVPSGEEPFLTVCHVQSLSQEIFDLEDGLGNGLDDLELADRKEEPEASNTPTVFQR